MKHRFSALLFALIVTSAVAVCAAGPLATVQARVEEALVVLQDPGLQGEANKAAKQARVEQIADRLFDFEALARFTLAAHWNKLNGDQQREFIGLYRQLLKRAYLDKVLSYTNERILFDKEVVFSPERAEVQTTVVTASARVPVHYRLLAANDTWKVYDVVIEGISLVRNYRSQFNGILATQTPAQLLQQIRDKLI